MYDHSVMVMDISRDISNALDIEIDEDVLFISALLHDIGKTYLSDSQEFLTKNHESLNVVVSQEFIDSLNLSIAQKDLIKDIISGKNQSQESQIIRDADALAMYKDERLQMLYIKRACSNDLYTEITRKVDKFFKVNLGVSTNIWNIWYHKFLENWWQYLKQIGYKHEKFDI